MRRLVRVPEEATLMPASRVCPCTGCAEHNGKCPALTTKGRCKPCAIALDRQRGSRQERGYGPQHEKEREKWIPLVAEGNVACARCGELITPGHAWHLDHNARRSGYLGPSHVRCNVRARTR